MMKYMPHTLISKLLKKNLDVWVKEKSQQPKILSVSKMHQYILFL